MVSDLAVALAFAAVFSEVLLSFCAVLCPAVGGHSTQSVRTVGVKNLDAQQIAEHVQWLQSTKGRPTQRKVPPRRVISRNPSIQGAWSVETFAATGAQQQQQQRQSHGL